DERKSDAGPDNRISNGENTVYNSGDLRVLGNSTPRFRFGLNGNVSWKNFSLNLFFQGVAKRDVFISDRMLFGGSDSGGNLHTFENSWTPENPNSQYHMYGRSQNLVTNSRYMYNGAYVRLKTLAVGYTLPQQWTKKLSLNTVRFNLSGYDLFTISGVPNVFDPESIQSAYPMMRSIALGVQVNF
ncbi:MAG: SusC/RagA family TonB-linked outer membrane protein, partial [Bacteroides sp.]